MTIRIGGATLLSCAICGSVADRRRAAIDAIAYPLGEGVGGQRRADDIALNDVAPVLAEEFQLFLALDALGDHREFEAVCQGDDGLGDGDVVFVGRQAIDEGFVEASMSRWEIA